MSRAIAAVALAVALAGCSTLPALGPCGNGVVEAGEACDEDSDLCADCQLLCVTSEVVADAGVEDDYVNLDPEVDASDADDRYCPAGNGCGSDGVCRAPSARFHPVAEPVALESERIQAGDVDADDIADVIAIGDSQVSVLYGAGGEDAFLNRAVLPGPIVTGRPFAADLDLDGGTDLLIPSLSGLIELNSEDGVLGGTLGVTEVQLPVSFDPDDVEALVAAVGQAASRQAKGIGIAQTATGVVAIELPAGQLGSCGPAGSVLIKGIALWPGTFGDTFAIAVDAPDPLNDRVCVFWPDTVLPTWNLEVIPLTLGRRIDGERGHLVFAHVDASDPCPQLVVPTTDDVGPDLIAIHTTGTCNFTSTSVTSIVAGDIAPYEKLLAAGDVLPDNGGTLDELVTSGGIASHKTETTPFTYAFRATALGGEPWSGAVVGDIDGDHVNDVVASRVGPNNQPDNDLAVVLTRVSGDVVAFNPVVVDTLGGVGQVVGGDFDANQAIDVAFVEDRSDAAGEVASAVSVLYGNVGALPDPPLVFDTLAGKVILTTVHPRAGGLTTLLEADALDDLAVAQLDGQGSIDHAAIGIAFGTAARFLSSPQWFGPSDVSLLGAAAADFGAGSADALDIAVFARRNTENTCVTSKLPTWYWADGAPDSGCDVESSLPQSESLALTAARNAAGDAVIVAATDGGKVFADPWGGGTCDAELSEPTQTPAFDLASADIDASAPGDELIAAFGRRLQDLGGESVYLIPAIDGCTVAPESTWIDLARAVGVAQSASCAGAVAVPPPPTGGDPGWRTLVVACDDAGLYVLRHAGGELVPFGDPVDLDGSPLATVAGDFTGDGVDDVAVLSRLGGVATLALYAQCATTDVDGDCAP